MSVHATYHAALRWARFAPRQGARFDVEKKAAEALRFSLTAGARRFCVPSKLVGVTAAGVQSRLRILAAQVRHGGPQPLKLVRAGEHVHAHAPAVREGDGFVGRVQPKHLRWLLPLVERGAVRCHALQVTGGTPARPSRGVNVVFSFTAAGRAEGVARTASA